MLRLLFGGINMCVVSSVVCLLCVLFSVAGKNRILALAGRVLVVLLFCKRGEKVSSKFIINNPFIVNPIIP